MKTNYKLLLLANMFVKEIVFNDEILLFLNVYAFFVGGGGVITLQNLLGVT